MNLTAIFHGYDKIDEYDDKYSMNSYELDTKVYDIEPGLTLLPNYIGSGPTIKNSLEWDLINSFWICRVLPGYAKLITSSRYDVVVVDLSPDLSYICKWFVMISDLKIIPCEPTIQIKQTAKRVINLIMDSIIKCDESFGSTQICALRYKMKRLVHKGQIPKQYADTPPHPKIYSIFIDRVEDAEEMKKQINDEMKEYLVGSLNLKYNKEAAKDYVNAYNEEFDELISYILTL